MVNTEDRDKIMALQYEVFLLKKRIELFEAFLDSENLLLEKYKVWNIERLLNKESEEKNEREDC